MIQNEDIALNSLKITSNIDSYDNYSGSLILRGGLGCKKTIHTKNLCSDKISVKELCVDYVDCLNVDKLKCRNLNCDFAEINELHLEEASFNKLLPNTNCNNIGDEYNRVNLYSNDLDNYNSNIENLNTKNADIDHLNVKNDINLSENYKKNIMIKTNVENNRIDFNFDILSLNGTFDKLDISDEGIEFNGLSILNFLLISDSNITNIIYPKKTLILINNSTIIDYILCNTRLENDCCNVKDGSYVKIVNISNLLITINKLPIQQNTNLEFIFINQKWICLNIQGFIQKKDEDNCICDSQDETIESNFNNINSSEEFTVGCIYGNNNNKNI